MHENLTKNAQEKAEIIQMNFEKSLNINENFSIENMKNHEKEDSLSENCVNFYF